MTKGAQGKSAAVPRPDRASKHVLAAYVDVDVYRAFKILAAEQLATTNAMVTHGLALLFQHHGKPLPPTLTRKLKDYGLA